MRTVGCFLLPLVAAPSCACAAVCCADCAHCSALSTGLGTFSSEADETQGAIGAHTEQRAIDAQEEKLFLQQLAAGLQAHMCVCVCVVCARFPVRYAKVWWSSRYSSCPGIASTPSPNSRRQAKQGHRHSAHTVCCFQLAGQGSCPKLCLCPAVLCGLRSVWCAQYRDRKTAARRGDVTHNGVKGAH